MTLVCTFRGSRSEPAEYESTNPVECIKCGWTGDAEFDEGQYVHIHGIAEQYLWALDGDVVCHECSLFCSDCGENLLDGRDFIGCCPDPETLLCWYCMGDALCPGN